MAAKGDRFLLIWTEGLLKQKLPEVFNNLYVVGYELLMHCIITGWVIVLLKSCHYRQLSFWTGCELTLYYQDMNTFLWQVNEIVAQQQTMFKELDTVLEAYLAIHPK